MARALPDQKLIARAESQPCASVSDWQRGARQKLPQHRALPGQPCRCTIAPHPGTPSLHAQVWGHPAAGTPMPQEPPSAPALLPAGAGGSQGGTSGMMVSYGRCWKTGALSLRSSTMIVSFLETYRVSGRAHDGCRRWCRAELGAVPAPCAHPGSEASQHHLPLGKAQLQPPSPPSLIHGPVETLLLSLSPSPAAVTQPMPRYLLHRLSHRAPSR